jgi:hypothetical protein
VTVVEEKGSKQDSGLRAVDIDKLPAAEDLDRP